jgi:hypothetical protein
MAWVGRGRQEAAWVGIGCYGLAGEVTGRRGKGEAGAGTGDRRGQAGDRQGTGRDRQGTGRDRHREDVHGQLHILIARGELLGNGARRIANALLFLPLRGGLDI